MRTCTACGETKPLSEFYVKNKRPGAEGYNQPAAECKLCSARRTRERRKADPQQVRQTGSHSKLRSRYSVTPEAYAARLAAQGGGCAICGAPASADGRRLSVDHDHSTGRVRGLLCEPCNPALGCFKDDPDLLDAVALYLERGAA